MIYSYPSPGLSCVKGKLCAVVHRCFSGSNHTHWLNSSTILIHFVFNSWYINKDISDERGCVDDVAPFHFFFFFFLGGGGVQLNVTVKLSGDIFWMPPILCISAWLYRELSNWILNTSRAALLQLAHLENIGWYIDLVVQQRHKSSALAMVLRLSCTNPSLRYVTILIWSFSAYFTEGFMSKCFSSWPILPRHWEISYDITVYCTLIIAFLLLDGYWATMRQIKKQNVNKLIEYYLLLMIWVTVWKNSPHARVPVYW